MPNVDWRAAGIRVLIACAVFIIICLVIDASAIRGARQLPQWLKDVFDFLTDFGKSGWFLWPLGALGLALAATPASLPRLVRLELTSIAVRAGFLFFAIGVPSLFAAIIKRFVGRARPFVGGDANPWLYHPFEGSAAYASFPSGHATTAFAAAFAIGLLWPRLRLAMWIYAIVIAISRVVLTAHHPSDVLAGALVGVVGVIVVRAYFVSHRLVFGVSPNGKITVLPGPSWRRLKSVARALLAD
ncbi:MAG: phosphatase PAP2 family protein [Pseudolabrys sp.]|nr:phosphatase PAP2 family protein [Pseudolabrys sp.]